MLISENDSAYLACRSLVDGLAAAGVVDAVVCPGSRSMPLALTVDATAELRTWVRIDERSAGYFALGLAKGSGTPTVLVCTSGTAAANFLPAVVEAHYSGVPLVVLTADRPPELRDWGAGQTIDQHSLYGSHVRWFCETPVASELAPAEASRWFGAAAARAVSVATGPRSGPVHLNVPFREPLEPATAGSETVESDQGAWATENRGQGVWAAGPVAEYPTTGASSGRGGPIRRHPQGVLEASLAAAAALGDIALEHARGVVVAGPMDDGDCWADAVAAFCRRSGWPLLAEPCSQLRRDMAGVTVVDHHDLLLRTNWADGEPPDAVLRVGGPPTCKPLRLWIERHRPAFALADPGGTWSDASFGVSMHLRANAGDLAAAAEFIDEGIGRRRADWAQRWAAADALAAEAVDAVLDEAPADAVLDGGSDERLGGGLLEAGIARQLGRSLASGQALFVSNSMPIRDVDTYLRARSEPLRVYANRGASGIDGVISAAAGVAASGTPTTLLIGDLAFRHDLGGLVAAVDGADPAGIDLTVVVVDNGGGTIFSFLPAHGVIDGDAFSRVLTTPQTQSSAALAGALATAVGFEHHRVESCEGLHQVLSAQRSGCGLRVVTVDVDAVANRAQHRRLADAVTAAVSDRS